MGMSTRSAEAFLKIKKAKHVPTKQVEQHRFLEGNQQGVLQLMEEFSQKGWKVASFGWKPHLGGENWYALMTRDLRLV